MWWQVYMNVVEWHPKCVLGDEYLIYFVCCKLRIRVLHHHCAVSPSRNANVAECATSTKIHCEIIAGNFLLLWFPRFFILFEGWEVLILFSQFVLVCLDHCCRFLLLFDWEKEWELGATTKWFCFVLIYYKRLSNPQRLITNLLWVLKLKY